MAGCAGTSGSGLHGSGQLIELRLPGPPISRTWPRVAGSVMACSTRQATGVLGVLVITSEYATGLIRTSLAAVPRRLPVLWGKAGLLAVATVAVSLPAAFTVFLAGQSILARQHLGATLSQPGVARAVIGSALYLAVAGLIGLGLGTLLRSTAGGIAALFGLLFAVQIVAGFLPGS